MTSLPAWLSWLTGFLQATLWLLLLIALSYVFLWMAAFIAAPFNAQLAEKTIAVVFGDGGQSAWQLKTLLKDLGPTLIRELQKFWYWFPKAVLLLLLILIPIFNLAVPLLSFLFNAWMLSVQSLDYNYENDRIAFPHALMQLRQHRAALIGFGAPAGLMALIPIVNFFVLPATVIGGAVLWYRLQMPAPITSSQQL